MAEQTANTGNNFLDPERIVAGFGLKKGDHAADFGAGHGYFSLALARAVGREGKVWAVDVQQSALDMIRSRAMTEHLLNIEYARADLEAPDASRLPERFMDFVLMGNILFQAEERAEIIREARRILREGGKMAIIEWDVMPPLPDIEGNGTDGTGDLQATLSNIRSETLGPAQALRIKKADAKALAAHAGFEPDREFSAGPHHYGLLFKKP